MAHESFESQDAADVLNASFVSVKVDREERPDIDHIYMTVCQALTGSGGWPLTIFLTPDKKPFYAGTYFPKNDRMGMPGLMTLLMRVICIHRRQGPARASRLRFRGLPRPRSRRFCARPGHCSGARANRCISPDTS
jgi:uncharacterized protein YyaL (SSP411 family)